MPVEVNNEKLGALIGDELGVEGLCLSFQDTVTGMLLAGIGDKSTANGPNYFIVDKGIPPEEEG